MRLEGLYRHLSPLFRPLAVPYGYLMQERRKSYENGTRAQYKPACPCISVGNIAWGGTGKTPFVSMLLSMAEKKGLKAVVLTRGYKSMEKTEPLLVSPATSALEAGDEALLLARAHPNSSIVVFPKRAESAYFAEEKLAPDLLILDDGMQHLALARDMDIVLLRQEDLTTGWDRVIPSGEWREPASALKSAAAFACKIDSEDFEHLSPIIKQRLAHFKVPFFSFTIKPIGLRHLIGKVEVATEPVLPMERYLLLSGVGSPTGVEVTAQEFFKAAPLEHFIFSDHHAYTEHDVLEVLTVAKRYGKGVPIICTAKDAVKLEPLRSFFDSYPILVLETDLVFGAAMFTEKSFPLWWEEFVNDRISIS